MSKQDLKKVNTVRKVNHTKKVTQINQVHPRFTHQFNYCDVSHLRRKPFLTHLTTHEVNLVGWAGE